MSAGDMRLDGNVVAGQLQSLFSVDLTLAKITCAHCGRVDLFGRLHAYAPAMGTVVRCPKCGEVILRVVESAGRFWIDMRGVGCLDFEVIA